MSPVGPSRSIFGTGDDVGGAEGDDEAIGLFLGCSGKEVRVPIGAQSKRAWTSKVGIALVVIDGVTISNVGEYVGHMVDEESI